MGFKKGRAARAKAKIASDSMHDGEALGSDSFNIWHDDGSCVYYTACNGSEYRIDISTMTQTNVRKGTQRTIYRQQINTVSSTWIMWQFEARRNGHRLHMRSQYPKWVGFALNERWQALKSHGNETNSEMDHDTAWSKVVNELDEAAFASIFEPYIANAPLLEHESNSCAVGSDLANLVAVDQKQLRTRLTRATSRDANFHQALFDRLVLCKWSPKSLSNAIRLLLKQGFQASGEHCRTIALCCGSVMALRVLLVEAKVDVYGLEIFQAGPGSIVKNLSVGNGGWVQRCKLPVKLLLARGAVLGDHGSRSKLLKRLECDGDSLWARRILDSMRSSCSDIFFPDFVIQIVEDMLGLPREHDFVDE